jgi:two-component system LytT family response regulator
MNSSKAIVIPLPSIQPIDITRALSSLKKSSFLKLAVYTKDEIIFIPFDEIMYCSSKNNYTNIHTREGKIFFCCKTLKDIESRLPADFFLRIHQSYLVNVLDITALKRQSHEVEINNQLLIPYSRLMMKELYDLLGVA